MAMNIAEDGDGCIGGIHPELYHHVQDIGVDPAAAPAADCQGRVGGHEAAGKLRAAHPETRRWDWNLPHASACLLI